MGSGVGGLSNGQIAELLALEAEKVQGQLRLAFRRAARLGCIWPVEVTDLIQRGESLTLLPGVGPFIGKRIGGWIEAGVRVPRPPENRRGFLTLPEARRILGREPTWG